MAMDEGGFALPQPLNLKAPQKTEVVDDSSIQCREGSTPVSEVEENVEQKTGDVDNVSLFPRNISTLLTLLPCYPTTLLPQFLTLL